MKKQFCALSAGILALAAIFFLPLHLLAGITANSSANHVLGQVDYTHGGVNILSGNGVYSPSAVAVDKTSGRVYVCDYFNNRVLWWNSSTALSNGQSADGVIGQPDLLSSTWGCSQTVMSGPDAAAVDSSGNVWVADFYNNRVLKFAKPTANGQPAMLVLGQSDFVSNSVACTQTGMDYPDSVIIDSLGNVWVSDRNNNRVLEFTAPTNNGQAANIVLGQQNFVSHTGACTSTGLNDPYGLSVDISGNVWVADLINNRVIEYSGPSISSGMAASVVLGEPDFISSYNSCSSTGMADPVGVSVDNSGNVWVVDQYNNRVLEYSGSISSGMPASLVIGQPDFISNNAACQQDMLDSPQGICVDVSGNVWIADNENNRILKFNTPSGNNPSANLVLGQNDFTHWGENIIKNNGLFKPSDVAVDTTTGRLYVCDKSNCRVLWWNNPASFIDGQSADGVIGQPDLLFCDYACTQRGLGGMGQGPSGLSVDSSGNVWVADTYNNRVLKFARPTANGQPALLVIGQADFISSVSSCSQTNLNWPNGVNIDASGNVWVADSGNNRILKFQNPTANKPPASIVIGQKDFVSSISTCTQTGMGGLYPYQGPYGLSVDSSANLWVADTFNNRVLKFSTPLSSGMAASLVLGQSNFTTNGSACSPTGMNNPVGVIVDNSGNAWVADEHNSRIIRFTSPQSNGQAASQVIGQKDFTSSVMTCTQAGLGIPERLCLDGSSNLWATDFYNNRVLKFNVVQQTSINKDQDTTITFNSDYGPVTLFIPAGTFSSNVMITINVTQVPASKDSAIILSGVGIQITNNLGLQPVKDMKLILSYRAVDVTGLAAAKLAIAYYDTGLSKWHSVPSNTDTLHNQVAGYIRHLSQFAIVQLSGAADLSSVIVYPNPYNWRKAPAGVTIANLTQNAVIKIYNVAGQLIKTVSYTSGNGQAKWDGTNDGGSQVASGVYIMYIHASQGTKMLKVAVEK